MSRQFLKYSAGLIGLYLVVSYATGAGRTIRAGTRGAGTLVNAFQGKRIK